MARYPVMPIFTDAFLSDTIHLSDAETGSLMLLMVAGHPAGLPDDDKMLSRVARCSLKVWRSSRRRAMEDLFVISDGKWFPIGRIVPVDSRDLRPNQAEWIALRAAVFERDGYVCAYCGDTAGPFECDHVHPVSKGGGHGLDNLVTACRPCNRSKAARVLEDWQGMGAVP